MTLLHALIILGAGLVAGTVNTIVGAGSLVTFPTLLALGYAPVLANVSNTVGLVSGSVSGAVGYRRELKGQLRRILLLMPVVVIGTVIGASLLLALPAAAFRRVVPILILFAVVLVLVQPSISRRRTARGGAHREHPGPLLQSGTFLTSIYGGYFGAAQGVVLMGLFGITLDDDVQRLNAAKNVVAGTINAVGAIFFIFRTTIAWDVSILLFVGSTIGGQVGAVVGRRLSPKVLRATIAIVGTAVAIELIITG